MKKKIVDSYCNVSAYFQVSMLAKSKVILT